MCINISESMNSELQASASERTEQLDQWDREHSWHPFTQMAEYATLPQLHVERGEGCWLWDTEGNRYLDGNASIWTNAHGHNDPEINDALIDQIGKVAHSTYLGLSHPAGAELGKRLCDLAPEKLRRAIFSDNGSNAIEIALKLSFQFWQQIGQPDKRLVVGMENGYHGDTFGAMSVGNSVGFHGRFEPWLFDTLTFAAPECVEVVGNALHCEMESSLSELEALLSENAGKVAAVVVEPSIQGPAGMKLQPSGFLKRVESLCRQFEAHLILDEVFVGCGRAGFLFACEGEEVSPDFLCLAKGLTAGYLPMAATLTTEAVYAAFLGTVESGSGFYHGHTFTGNPLAARVALKSLEKLETLLDTGRLDATIRHFGERFEETFRDHPNARSIRQRGLAAAIDLAPTDGNPPWPLNDRVGMQVCIEARNQGLLLRPLLDSILIVPPLVISGEEIDFLFENLVISIDSVMNKICS